MSAVVIGGGSAPAKHKALQQEAVIKTVPETKPSPQSEIKRTTTLELLDAQDLIGKDVFDSKATQIGHVSSIKLDKIGSWRLVIEAGNRSLVVRAGDVSAIGDSVFLKVRAEEISREEASKGRPAEPINKDVVEDETTKICSRCGRQNPSRNNFCQGCGRSLN